MKMILDPLETNRCERIFKIEQNLRKKMKIIFRKFKKFKN